MTALFSTRSRRGLCPLVSYLEQKMLGGGQRHWDVQSAGDPAERTNIVRIRGFVASEAVAGGSGKQFRSAVDVDRRMYQEVQHNQER